MESEMNDQEEEVRSLKDLVGILQVQNVPSENKLFGLSSEQNTTKKSLLCKYAKLERTWLTANNTLDYFKFFNWHKARKSALLRRKNKFQNLS